MLSLKKCERWADFPDDHLSWLDSTTTNLRQGGHGLNGDKTRDQHPFTSHAGWPIDDEVPGRAIARRPSSLDWNVLRASSPLATRRKGDNAPV